MALECLSLCIPVIFHTCDRFDVRKSFLPVRISDLAFCGTKQKCRAVDLQWSMLYNALVAKNKLLRVFYQVGKVGACVWLKLEAISNWTYMA